MSGFVDVTADFPGHEHEIPGPDEWDRADSICREHGLDPLPRSSHPSIDGKVEAPGNRAFLRSWLRRALIIAGVTVTMSDGSTL